MIRGRSHLLSLQLPPEPVWLEADPALNDEVDAAYRSKYARYGATYVDAMVGESAAAATLRLVPR